MFLIKKVYFKAYEFFCYSGLDANKLCVIFLSFQNLF